MGGYFSGRRNQNGKKLTVSYDSLDIRLLQRKGLLAAGSSTDLSLSGGNRAVSLVKVTREYSRVILRYSHRLENGNLKFENYPVSIECEPDGFFAESESCRCFHVLCALWVRDNAARIKTTQPATQI